MNIGVMDKYLQPCVYCGNSVLSEGIDFHPVCIQCWERMLSPEATRAYKSQWKKLNKEYSKINGISEKLYKKKNIEERAGEWVNDYFKR